MKTSVMLTAFALLMLSANAFAIALTPQQCDQVAGWVYAQAELRNAGTALNEHEAAVRLGNAALGPDMIAYLIRELRRVYGEKKEPIVAAMEARYRCYSVKGEIGAES